MFSAKPKKRRKNPTKPGKDQEIVLRALDKEINLGGVPFDLNNRKLPPLISDRGEVMRESLVRQYIREMHLGLKCIEISRDKMVSINDLGKKFIRQAIRRDKKLMQNS